MKRGMIVLLLCAGCGGANPAGNSDGTTPPAQAPMVVIRMADFDAYLGRVTQAFVSVDVMINEFTAISQDLQGGMVSEYWIQQYMKNLLKRLQLMQAQAVDIRPAHPELLRLHTEEYEMALTRFQEAFEAFLGQFTFPDPNEVSGINDKIVAGNTHLIRFQIFLSQLAGRQVSFLREEI